MDFITSVPRLIGPRIEDRLNQMLRYGVKKFDNGEYRGLLLTGKRHGKGVMRYNNGDKYIGDWKNDKRHGRGTLYDENDRIIFRGMW